MRVSEEEVDAYYNTEERMNELRMILDQYKATPGTACRYGSAKHHVLHALGREELAEVEKGVITEFLREWADSAR